MAGTRARRRPGENRARLLEAGLIEFGLFGFQGASTGAIASRAGVPQPHLYASFPSKADLFLACFAHVRARLSVSGPEAPSEAIDGSGGGAPPAEHGVSARFLLQAVAASNDPLLREPLQRELSDFAAALGPSFVEALCVASEGLLRPVG